MEEQEIKQERRDNKPLVAILTIAILGIVGTTFAYFMSTDTFDGVFGTKTYTTQVVETFESPDDWTPGTETSKTVIARNLGDVEAAVRVSYTENWVDSQNNPLDLVDASGARAAIINFTNGYATNWTSSVENGTTYYYYNQRLAQNASTTSLIRSVTFNPAVTIGTDNNCATVGSTTTCTTTTSGYAGGTYNLDIKVETVQYDQYKAAWNTLVEIR